MKGDEKGNSPIQVKTFVFEMSETEPEDMDAVVNAFCRDHKPMSVVLDRHNSKLIYRVVYKYS